jgi:uncharacterized Zn-binding protein involved in type VI secretion
MGMPAARISDMHVCPKVNPGPVPHVGGPIAAGSPNVIIGSMPAARVGDMAICVGPPDSVSKGSSGVLINGKAAARIGDSTSHGGKIVVGYPTVLIGGGGGGGGQSANVADEAVNVNINPSVGVGDAPKMVPHTLLASSPLAQSLSDAAVDGSPFTESPFCEVCDKK